MISQFFCKLNSSKLAELISQFFCKLNSSKYFTWPSGKLRTEFTSPVAKSTSNGLSDASFFARCQENRVDCATLKGLSSLLKTTLTVPLNSYISSPSLHDYNVKLANAMSYGGHNNDQTKAMVTAKSTFFKKEKKHWLYKQTNSVLMSVDRS